uniref:G_PROTEIN_RECEP_F1_2 domain-containing protein n=1 Tax=Brugia timori TaxID=42155 RepID=A0A0R3R6M8_9BILA
LAQLSMSKMMASYYCITVVLLILSLNCHAENATNLFDIRNECNTVEKYVAVILFSLLLLYGIASNVLLMVVYCIHNNIYSRTFIHITYQIIVCSFLNFIPQMTVVLGGILWDKNFDNKYFSLICHHFYYLFIYLFVYLFINPDMSIRIHRIFAAMDTFTFFATLHFTFLLAINRLVVICFPKFNAFFESIKFYFLISFLWLLSFDNILAISLTEFHCCIKTFHVSNLHWSINCTKRMSEIGVAFL